MTQEDKQLLLKDLCARLPYGVKVKTKDDDDAYTLLSLHPNKNIALIGLLFVDTYATSKVHIDEIKPYLRPMSSMTKEEKNYYEDRWFEGYHCLHGDDMVSEPEIPSYIDWLLQNHFDFRGLIDKGLAIEVTESNNPYKD